ncbi:MAG: hypothetical protein KF914_10640 [Rhizobiaceae bacterium]|nr:hypothetical protein [Rhizobiaceae bacterium]
METPRKLWGRVGAYASHEDPLVAASNWVALVVAWNQPFYPLYLYPIVGERLAPSLLTFLSTPLFLAIPAVARRRPLLARALLPVVGMANTMITAKALGVQSGVETFLIPCALIAAGFFRPPERAVGLPLVGLAFAIYWLMHDRYGAPLAAYSGEEYASLSSLNALSAATLTVFVGLLLAGLAGPRRAAPDQGDGTT